jgi:hypothetical protein
VMSTEIGFVSPVSSRSGASGLQIGLQKRTRGHHDGCGYCRRVSGMGGGVGARVLAEL